MKRILLIDNYDSFVYNLAHSIAISGGEPVVLRNDRLTAEEAGDGYDGIVISPGPGHPGNASDFGVCSDVLRTVSKDLPTLGICLGMQGIAHVFGAEVGRAALPMHGKVSTVLHDGSRIFEGVPSPFQAGRYHSLCVHDEHLPDGLKVIARTEDGIVMGIEHRTHPIIGLQFHPESILTGHGQRIMDNFISMVEGRP